MSGSSVKRYGVFNVVAQPHPSGIYREVFEKSVRIGVKYWGDYFAAITPISSSRDDVFVGKLAIWMAVDPQSSVIDLGSFHEAPLTETDEVVIPSSVGLNSRTFDFAFDEVKHRLFLELRNDQGKSVSPKRAEAALQQALGQAAADLTEEFRVQIVPTEDTLEKIFSIPRLSSLEIKILRPNDDSVTPEANAVIKEELEDQNLKEVTKVLKKAPGASTIVVNARNKLLAAAAMVDGYVRGKGKLSDGTSTEVDTKAHPAIIEIPKDQIETEGGGARSAAKRG